MPRIDGRETASFLEQVLPDAVVVMVSADGGPDLKALTPAVLRALWAGRRPD